MGVAETCGLQPAWVGQRRGRSENLVFSASYLADLINSECGFSRTKHSESQFMRPLSQRGIIGHSSRVIGHSVLGAPLEVIECTSTSPQALIFAGIHGDEAETTLLLSRALRLLSPDQLASDVVLAVNPDGLARGTRGNANGVDLNRNFATTSWSSDPTCFKWDREGNRDVVLSPGVSPASEPETTALVKLVADRSPSIVVALHSPLECIEEPARSNVGAWLSLQTGMPHVEDIGYPTPGAFGAWALEQGHSAITYEMPNDQPFRMIEALHQPAVISLLRGKFPQ